ncbi:MAG TPA: TAXI family TRAP transporter solute-binding subunit, partial [bacterium]|nr:TAXI family TRAP transporter solute-binding subunit [bacterium]
MERRKFLLSVVVIVSCLLLAGTSVVSAQETVRLSVATGGTGGVYYPLGGGMAKALSKYLPKVDATAEVTAASVDNILLLKTKKAELALVMADVAYDGLKGTGQFKAQGSTTIRTVAVLYSNFMHFVALEGKGINSVADLKGKRVSTGAPGSGTEVKSLRVLEAYGINPDKDIRRERLSVAESAG